jgi:flavin reductase (DIM6/NTAB) family NADH-FMN oxidoreductase RutF
MIFDLDTLSPNRRYHLMTQSIMPRPIAWILSRNDNGSLNLAPFSFFNAICSDPPLVMLSIGRKDGGEIKDSRRNILSKRDFVIQIPSRHHAAAVTASAASLEYGESELASLDLELADFEGCSVPRIADAGVAIHCEFHEVHYLGPAQQAIVYARVRQFFVNDALVSESNGRYSIDAGALDPLARLGGAQYGALGELFSIARPA